jgi:hypothetical protein
VDLYYSYGKLKDVCLANSRILINTCPDCKSVHSCTSALVIRNSPILGDRNKRMEELAMLRIQALNNISALIRALTQAYTSDKNECTRIKANV